MRGWPKGADGLLCEAFSECHIAPFIKIDQSEESDSVPWDEAKLLKLVNF